MSELLASDADRDRVAERLRTAAGEGRLTPAELEERLERAFAARTDAELAPLVADLPATARPVSRRPDLRPFVAVSLLLVAIWAFTGMGYFWPVWPIAGWGISFLCPGRLGGPWSHGSSSRACSRSRWPSSLAAGPGSGARRR